MEEKYVVLGNLFKKEDEAKKLLSLSAEDAVKYLKDQYNLDFTVDELNDVAAGMKKAFDEENGSELSEESLEEVAGGKKSGAYNAGYYIGKSVKIVGTGISIVGGLVAIGVISW